jgi:hypothetical protein
MPLLIYYDQYFLQGHAYQEYDYDFNSYYNSYYNAYIFYLTGEPISLHLLCCKAFAVKDHSFIPCASHLQ